ncbi:hypothetical protein EV652_104190 [Kribbella steppae]|uniref:Uncharacterized protein n=1 Tax=Kribbella steppae TaxID=2512223 RepID=A0A4R2HN46_9ACTN|nr:hypothetical protein [Kribbella steppae]TCO32584.1 hypothetical protein EV652_104190 [Kribbella steppae]
MRRLTLAVLAVLLVAGCSSSTDDSSSPSSTPTNPRTTATPPTTTPSAPTDTGTALPVWTKMMRQPVDGQHLVTQQRKYLVTRGSDEAGTTTITDRASKKAVVRHVPAAGFVAQSPVVIDDRWALIEDIRSDGPDPEIRVYRYDLTTGRPADLSKLLPKVSEPEIGASDGTFAYSSTDARNRSCLIIAELATLKSRTVACVPGPGYVADPVVSADTVTFSEITAPESARRCKRILTAALSGGRVRPVPAATNCIQWSGASLRGATVWSEVGATDPDQYQSKAYVRESVDSPARALGVVVTDTIIACGHWILWETRTVDDGDEAYQINRWRPGLQQPQRIYTGKPGTALTPLTCQDNTVYVEAAQLATTPAYTETFSAPAT